MSESSESQTPHPMDLQTPATPRELHRLLKWASTKLSLAQFQRPEEETATYWDVMRAARANEPSEETAEHPPAKHAAIRFASQFLSEKLTHQNVAEIAHAVLDVGASAVATTLNMAIRSQRQIHEPYVSELKQLRTALTWAMSNLHTSVVHTREFRDGWAILGREVAEKTGGPCGAIAYVLATRVVCAECGPHDKHVGRVELPNVTTQGNTPGIITVEWKNNDQTG